MTPAELAHALWQALVRVFTGSTFTVWDTTPDQTAVPAVWGRVDAITAGPNKRADAQTIVNITAAIAPQVQTAEDATIYDAMFRMLQINAAELGCPVTFRDIRTDLATIGAVEHTAVLGSFTLDYALPC
jgi:hypothetical protein